VGARRPIATGARAALRGGFTTICAMPNTEPAIDSPGLVAELIARGAAANAARVLPIACITRTVTRFFERISALRSRIGPSNLPS